ncbi:MAG: hypothetical protein U0872_15420 [Planctomycetaceae bacterium]
MKRILYALAVVAFVLAMFVLPTLSHAQTYCVGGQCYQQSTSYPGGWQQVGSVSGPLGIMRYPVVDYAPPQTVTQSVIVPSTPTVSSRVISETVYDTSLPVLTAPGMTQRGSVAAIKSQGLSKIDGANNLWVDEGGQLYFSDFNGWNGPINFYPLKSPGAQQRSQFKENDQSSRRTRTRAGDVCRCGCVNCRCENCTCRR